MLQNGWRLNNLSLEFPGEEWITHSSDETIFLGKLIGHSLGLNSILCFSGDLGAGKTTLIKGIIEGITGLPSEVVTSPTFVYLTPYKGSTGPTVYHFDLYRLKDAEEFLLMGFEDYLSADGICCIEWSERISPLLPKGVHSLHLTHLEQERRRIRYDKISV